jgi:hypothetical protein
VKARQQILNLLAAVIVALAGCSSPKPPAISQTVGAYLVELTYTDLPYPPAPPDDGKGAVYVLDLVYVENAAPGEAAAAEIENSGEPLVVSIIMGADHGKPGLDTACMATALQNAGRQGRSGARLLLLLGKDHWTDGNRLTVLVPQTVRSISGDTLAEFSGTGRAALRLAPYRSRYPSSGWQSEPIEVELDFTVF